MIKDYTAYLIKRHGKNWQKLADHLPHSGFHYLEVTKPADKTRLRKAWENQMKNQPGAAWTQVKNEWQLAGLTESFEQPQLSLAELPPLSFRVSFKFTLAKPASYSETRPFFSRDEEALYVIDNPVRKDKMLRLPFLAPASYKGLLRSAARQVIGDPLSGERHPEHPALDNDQIKRLFGTDRREQTKDLRQGRLWLFPTFFREVGLKIINPHLRDTGAGAKPILFETATGAGNFHLLYLPFDLTPTSFQEVAEDLRAVAGAIKELFTAHGLGAKTSSGFGLADDKLEPGTGKIEIKAAGLPPQQEPAKPAAPAAPPMILAKYLKAEGQLKDEYISEAGEMLSEADYQTRLAQRGQPYGKNQKQTYEKARGWWEREGKNRTPVEPVLAAPVAKLPVGEWTFESFSDLVKVADELATALEQLAGGER